MSRAIALITMAVLLLSNPPCFAQQPDLERIAAMPGTTVTREKNAKGEDKVTVERGGVTIVLEPHQVTAEDNSGLGAVLCTWQIMVDLKVALDNCQSAKYEDLRQELSAVVDRINDFIVVNSLAPTKKESLEAYVAARNENFRLNILNDPRQCLSKQFERWYENMLSTSREERKAKIDKFLSVPRPPVISPCI